MEENYKKIIGNYIQNLEVLEVYIKGLEDMLFYQSEKLKPEALEDGILKPLFEAISIIGEEIGNEQKNEKVMKYNEEFSHGSLIYEYDEENGKSNLKFQFDDATVAHKFEKITNKMLLTVRQIPMIFTSSLISLAVYFELLATKLVQEKLMAHPEAMNLKQKSLSIAQIEEIGSLEEAKNFLIEQEVMDLMHQGFKSWMTYFEKKMNVNINKIKGNIEEVNEVFCRRHLFVHNGGVVNNIYLTRVDQQYREGILLGEEIVVDEPYFLNALKLFKRFGIILGLESWKRSAKQSKKRVNYVLKYIFQLLIEEEFDLAAILCEFVMDEHNLEASSKWVAQINYWLAQKRLGKFNEIQQEISNADLSALSSEYQLCRYALLEKYEAFFHLLEHSFPKPIGISELEGWPIFYKVRETQEYKEFFEKHQQGLQLVENT